MEVKGGDDPFADPWEKQRDAKRKRTEKNTEQHMRNEERAGNLSKGTSTRILKSINASRKAGREGGNLDVPVGVPVDLKPSGRKGSSDVVATTTHKLQRGKASTAAALLATQISTASLGRFDKMREGEPERSKAISKSVVKKRKFESTTDKNIISTEVERSMKVLKSLSTGGVCKEKDRKKGRLATGETAYDYEFDDGLGASTFRKKKGRAGAGKMKKMTKKRTK
jgi:regulator of ribosome biosynthesis